MVPNECVESRAAEGLLLIGYSPPLPPVSPAASRSYHRRASTSCFTFWYPSSSGPLVRDARHRLLVNPRLFEWQLRSSTDACRFQSSTFEQRHYLLGVRQLRRRTMPNASSRTPEPITPATPMACYARLTRDVSAPGDRRVRGGASH